MRWTSVFLLFVLATPCVGEENIIRASRVIEGQKSTFPVKEIPNGVQVALAALQSCHSQDWPDRKPPSMERMEQVKKGDHVRLVFTKPVKLTVLNTRLEVSELVFSEKAGFWVRSGKKAYFFTKYKPEKMKPFDKWRNQLLPVDQPKQL